MIAKSRQSKLMRVLKTCRNVLKEELQEASTLGSSTNDGLIATEGIDTPKQRLSIKIVLNAQCAGDNFSNI